MTVSVNAHLYVITLEDEETRSKILYPKQIFANFSDGHFAMMKGNVHDRVSNTHEEVSDKSRNLKGFRLETENYPPIA